MYKFFAVVYEAFAGAVSHSEIEGSTVTAVHEVARHYVRSLSALLCFSSTTITTGKGGVVQWQITEPAEQGTGHEETTSFRSAHRYKGNYSYVWRKTKKAAMPAIYASWPIGYTVFRGECGILFTLPKTCGKRSHKWYAISSMSWSKQSNSRGNECYCHNNRVRKLMEINFILNCEL